MNEKQIKELGQSLRSIDEKLLIHESGKTDCHRIWLQGGEAYFDIFIEMKADQIEWLQFTLRGKLLSWYRKDQQIVTGATNELKTDDITFYPASKIMSIERKPDQDFIKLVKAILSVRKGEYIFDKILYIINNDGHEYS
jgi:hypothetical protein